MENKDTIPDIALQQLQVITAPQAWDYRIIPFGVSAEEVQFYSDTIDVAIQTEMELILDKTIVIELLPTRTIDRLLQKYYRRQSERRDSRTTPIETSVNDTLFLEKLIGEAYDLGASDIHLEPYEKVCRIRLRIDGKLMNRYELERKAYPSIVNKIKIKASLDIAEKRLPQDGRIFYQEKKQRIDIRVSCLPTLHGEKIVLRLLAGGNASVNIQDLGFSAADQKKYLEGIYQTNGLVLISGPTGSGKTTTLYATLKILNEQSRNIMTIEDPIEYTLEGINQVQLKENIGLGFASTLRTFLRQDPDVIMVGEIRDIETASMAVRASLTGHLVLSTIHTNSAWGIIGRLIDMGVPAYLLAETLNSAVAQRLVRLLCPHCKREESAASMVFPKDFQVFYECSSHFVANGCENCHYTGYKGRKAVYEIIPIDRVFSEKIKKQELNISSLRTERGIDSLAKNAFDLLAAGTTSLDEVYPILASADR